MDTFWIRYYPVSRIVLPKQIRTIRISFANDRIKEITLPDGCKRFKLEMDDDRISSETGRPISGLRKEVEKEITRQNKE